MMRTRCTLTPYVGLGLTRELSQVVRCAAPQPLLWRRCLHSPVTAVRSNTISRAGGCGFTSSTTALLAISRAMTSLGNTRYATSALHSCGRGHLQHRRVQIAAAALTLQARFMHVRDKPDNSEKAGGEKTSPQEEEAKEGEGEKSNNAEEAEGKGKEEGHAKKGANKRTKGQKFSFADHIRGLKADYVNFPDIYNSANAINFVIFTVFCLCSTGSNTEEEWWMEHWALDNTLRPYNWLLHSFLTNNFLTMTYAMMMLHSMCHQMLPTIGSRNLLLYVAATAVISGAIMWAGNRIAYGAQEKAREKQFGPWDVVSAMFVMQYLYFAISPMTTLNSFTSWMRYACWVGQICIMYFDWQPTFVGAAVGLALCKGVPRFRVKPMVS